MPPPRRSAAGSARRPGLRVAAVAAAERVGYPLVVKGELPGMVSEALDLAGNPALVPPLAFAVDVRARPSPAEVVT